MSGLKSFFDELDTDAKFNAWKGSMIKKLSYLKDIIPEGEEGSLLYIEETINFIDNLTHVSSDYASYNPDDTNKQIIMERLKTCNSLYRKFGN